MKVWEGEGCTGEGEGCPKCGGAQNSVSKIHYRGLHMPCAKWQRRVKGVQGRVRGKQRGVKGAKSDATEGTG